MYKDILHINLQHLACISPKTPWQNSNALADINVSAVSEISLCMYSNQPKFLNSLTEYFT